MKEIQERMLFLDSAYKRQLSGYKQLLESSRSENQLIKTGKIEELLGVLEKKEEHMSEISAQEGEIKETQSFLARFFGLKEFSLPQVRKVAPSKYDPYLEDIQTTVNALLAILEELEEHERAHEVMLKEYESILKNELPDIQSRKQAMRAYSKPNKGKP